MLLYTCQERDLTNKKNETKKVKNAISANTLHNRNCDDFEQIATREENITPRIGSSGARTRWLKTESEAAVGEAEMPSLEAIG